MVPKPIPFILKAKEFPSLAHAEAAATELRQLFAEPDLADWIPLAVRVDPDGEGPSGPDTENAELREEIQFHARHVLEAWRNA